MAKRKPSELNLLLAVDKPVGITSHDVVSKVRRALGERRVGHAGTLDPLASGVMIVGVGQATRLLGRVTLDRKRYLARITLGPRPRPTMRKERSRALLPQRTILVLGSSPRASSRIFSVSRSKSRRRTPRFPSTVCDRTNEPGLGRMSISQRAPSRCMLPTSWR